MTFMNSLIESLLQTDPEIAESFKKEFNRQEYKLELIASENYASEAVIRTMGSVLTNKYAEGYPGKRYYGGCDYVDEVETLAIERSKKLFQAGFSNVQPHSGANANLAVYFAALSPRDKVLGMNLSEGGHLTHGSPVNFSGKLYEVIAYGVDPKTHRIDYDQLRDLAKTHRPKLLIGGASAYPRIIDFKTMGEIAKEVGALFLVDMAHIAGLVAAGEHPTPVGHADFVTSTTHKTLRGPRGGLILTQDEAWAKKVNSAVFPGSQGGPLMHVIAAKAVSFLEALKPEFKTYQAQVVRNSKAMASRLMELGYQLVSGGTENHLMLLDLTPQDITGKDAEKGLDLAGITVNKNTIPGEKRSPFITSGLRIGVPAVTTRGMGENEMREIADLIHEALQHLQNTGHLALVQKKVKALCERFPIYKA